jgi:hypothetical protein
VLGCCFLLEVGCRAGGRVRHFSAAFDLHISMTQQHLPMHEHEGDWMSVALTPFGIALANNAAVAWLDLVWQSCFYFRVYASLPELYRGFPALQRDVLRLQDGGLKCKSMIPARSPGLSLVRRPSKNATPSLAQMLSCTSATLNGDESVRAAYILEGRCAGIM